MCGRTSLTATPEELAEAFALDEPPAVVPRYNIAPTQPMPAVRVHPATGRRRLGLLRFGLVPHWAADPAVGARLINARSETARTRAAFRDPFRERRCLVPATGFYEWRRAGRGRQPYLLRRRDGRPMGLAAVWDRWRPPTGAGGPDAIESCAILTTPANELVARLHDRMPLVLPAADYSLWLDPAVTDPARLRALLRPYPAEEMVAIPVSPRVNSPHNDDPSLLDPVDLDAQPHQRTLF
ncbi:MAG TPA: SOS response-associated peptidase [Vicinamibacteria bacterium]|nr:SOS response-associated peptidase [Vicinamibacteria bacterium]